mmetsp:Transcript_3102/g.19117  ORF Transcript_3102/g.19117 Transcript_3102/m.19117 type:complete len:194 (+) Transcript_3102:1145-1726(+)
MVLVPRQDAVVMVLSEEAEEDVVDVAQLAVAPIITGTLQIKSRLHLQQHVCKNGDGRTGQNPKSDSHMQERQCTEGAGDKCDWGPLLPALDGQSGLCFLSLKDVTELPPWAFLRPVYKWQKNAPHCNDAGLTLVSQPCKQRTTKARTVPTLPTWRLDPEMSSACGDCCRTSLSKHRAPRLCLDFGLFSLCARS